MHLVFQLLTLVHLVGFATLLGGCVIQFRSLEPEVNVPMVVGAWTQVATGVVLAGLLEMSADPTHPVNHVKLGVKLVIALIVLLLVAKNRKFQSIPRGLWTLITGLTLVNAGVAVLWG